MTTEPPIIRFTNPAALSQPRGYSHVVEVTGGKTIYIAGQVALDSAGKLVGAGDIRAQAQQVFANLKAALESVGASFENVVKINIYLSDAAQIVVVREVRNQFINADHPPVSTALQVGGFVVNGLLIEIDAVAVIG